MPPELEADKPGRTHLAHYEGAETLPRVPTPLWWRLVTLLRTRGNEIHPCALRMAQHLTHRADKTGHLTDIPAVLDAYSSRCGLSRRVGWTDFMRLVEAGLVRQVCAAAPERQARYVLVMDLAALPDDLPADLARELRRYVDDPRTAAKGRPTRAGEDAALAECEVIREGSAAGPRVASKLGCGRLHTSPYMREGSPPSPQPRQSQGPQRPPLEPAWGQDRNDEKAAALDFVKELGPEWARQRGGQVLSENEIGEIAHLVVLLLHHVRRSEAAELLTAQVSSATDLAGVLRWRIGRTLAGLRRAQRRSEALRVDDDGERHAAFLEVNAARNAANAARKAALVEEARRRAREIRQQREARAESPLAARTHSPDRRRGPEPAPAAIVPLRHYGTALEPESVFRREVLERHHAPAPAQSMWTEPEEVFQGELERQAACRSVAASSPAAPAAVTRAEQARVDETEAVGGVMLSDERRHG
ncbi:hypothetical protein IMZ11_39850 [Microtetraspora sp. AC03309]|uniref:hypothetical protein n=1 Tax=Microtetraspora sp. AC03309 TaxID=2779376 RepID=UPI001E411F1E|nr:hypothetical protein [Microtetraspora sp. AC03309]MCC5581773.1 hypothetical protein [Microtetraspora sp. AC03309]